MTIAVTVTLTLTCYIYNDVYHGHVLVHSAHTFTHLFSATTDRRDTRTDDRHMDRDETEQEEQSCIGIIVVKTTIIIQSGEAPFKQARSCHSTLGS